MIVRKGHQPEWPLFKCGHERSEQNTYRRGDYARCVQCAREASEDSRMRRMPDIIKATERKLAALYSEARRYGRDDLLTHKWAFDNAWDTEIRIAKLEAQLAGEECSMEGL